MDDRCVASKLRLERFARRLPRQNSYERAKIDHDIPASFAADKWR
jgi:hypothetical protein